MPVREKARPKPRASDEEFVLFLQGIPAHCRWQELKDLIRQTALHIRQAVVYDDHHGFPTGLGQIIVKNEDEAWRTYHRLSTNGWEGQSLVVTLSRTCAPTRPIAGPTKSPSASCLFAAAAAAAASSYPSLSGYSTPPRVSQNLAVPGSPLSMSPEPVLTTTPEYAPIIGLPPPPPSFIPVFPDALPSPPGSGSGPGPALRDPSSFTFTFLPTTYSLQSLHETPLTNIRMNARHPPSYPGKPTYTAPNTPNTPNTTLHNNTTTSTKNTRRTILIQNLPPHTTLTDLKAFFQDRVGPIEHCHLDTNTGSVNNSGCNKITARITYRTAESAKHAVALFNNVSFMGSKRIRVRVDRGFEFGTDFGAAAGYDPTPTSHGPNHGPSPTSGPGAGAGVSSGAVQHIPTPNPNPTPTTNTTPKSIPRANSTDRCQPLVVNGSGIGRNAGTTSAGAGAKIAVVV